MKIPSRILGGAVACATVVAGTVLGITSPAAAQVEPCVQNVAVVNNAGFVLSFRVATREGLQSAATDNYPINQYRLINLVDTPLPVDADVRPVVSAVAGAERAGDRYVSYCENGQTATYTVTGTTFDYTVELIG